MTMRVRRAIQHGRKGPELMPNTTESTKTIAKWRKRGSTAGLHGPEGRRIDLRRAEGETVTVAFEKVGSSSQRFCDADSSGSEVVPENGRRIALQARSSARFAQQIRALTRGPRFSPVYVLPATTP